MAKQRIHNQRAGRGGGSGSSWISYSDMMASLLLVFVLILCVSLYRHFSLMAAKQAELDAKQAELDAQALLLQEQSDTLDAQELLLASQRTTMLVQAVTLASKQAELDIANTALAEREAELLTLQATVTAQQEALDSQSARLDELVGVRSRIVRDLSSALSTANLKATVDPTTGDILLDSTVFFEVNSYTIKEEGRALLDAFVPVYLDVLLSEDYELYLGEIIIEGHTDSSGTYLNNLELSQNRALSVAKYCLSMPSLTPAQRAKLQQIMTATGRSFSDPIYNEDGTENADASRRVEFKFSLRDAEMIEQLNQILKENNQETLPETTDEEEDVQG